MGAFGMLGGKRSSCRKKHDDKPEPPRPTIDNRNPDPKKYHIIKHQEFPKTRHLLILIKYPNCTNYEGQKILLFHDLTLAELEAHGRVYGIDPHFCDRCVPKYCPIARFIPSDYGWDLAKKTVLAIGFMK